MNPPSSRPLARLRTACLLALASLIPFGASDLHAGHPAAGPDTPVFSDARHGGQASHWEAAESVAFPRCPACLLTSQQHGLAPGAAFAARQAIDGRRAGELLCSAPGPAPGRQVRPRAPPAR